MHGGPGDPRGPTQPSALHKGPGYGAQGPAAQWLGHMCRGLLHMGQGEVTLGLSKI